MYNAKRGFVGIGAAAVVAAGLISGGAAVAQSPAASMAAASAGSCTVGVSWNNFQQPRWAARDKPAIQSTVEAGGGTYIDADANLSTQQQITDVNTLIQKGANVIVLLAQDNKAVGPALAAAAAAGLRGRGTLLLPPVIDDPGASRLVHALFVDNADLALVLFDASDLRDPLHGVGFWLKQLQTGQTFMPSIAAPVIPAAETKSIPLYRL